MPRLKATPDTKIFTLKVTIKGSSPSIWRRIQIPGDATLGDLHYTLQIALGWTNSHLHEFQIGRKKFDAPLSDDPDRPDDMIDEDEWELNEVLERKKMKFGYHYDFGDDWMHEVVVEDITLPEKGVRYPVCLDGAQACPPEDCGGICGYYRMLDILKNPKHEEYQTYREWLPEDFDPTRFDIEEVNAELDRIDEWRRMAEDDDDVDGFEYDAEDSEYDAEGFEDDSEPFHYEPPVSQLLTLGKPQPELDYMSLGLGDEHVSKLLQMSVDPAFHCTDPDDPSAWAPLHAWRALCQLQYDAAAGGSSISLGDPDDEDGDMHAPEAIGDICAKSVSLLFSVFQDESRSIGDRAAAGLQLTKITECYEEERSACVDALTAQLKRHSKNSKGLNSFLVSALIELDGLEATPVIDRAFAAGSVDPGLKPHWDNLQAEIGLFDFPPAPQPTQTQFVPRILDKPVPSQKRKKTGKKATGDAHRNEPNK